MRISVMIEEMKADLAEIKEKVDTLTDIANAMLADGASQRAIAESSEPQEPEEAGD